MNKVKLAFLDVVGLKYTGNTLETRGLGGSESAIIYLSRELAKLDFEVTVFCKAEQEGYFDNVQYLDINRAKENNQIYDILVTSRSVVPYAPISAREILLKESGQDILNYQGLVNNSRYKILWLHDTFCSGDIWVEPILINGGFDEIFTLSDWHSNYIMNGHNWRQRIFEVLKSKIWQTRNGLFNYIPEVDITKKDKDLFVYNSSVSKGMEPLLNHVWKKVKEQIPTGKLEIIGGFYRGANQGGPDEQEIKWMELKNQFDGKDGVHFTGVISQKQIAELLSQASLMIYPAIFPETYGISTLEAINYNTPLVGCRFGALEEVAAEQTSYLINYPFNFNERQLDLFVNTFVGAYRNDYLRKQKMYACNEFKSFIGWDSVALQWKQHLFNKIDRYMPLVELKEVEKINKNISRIFKRRFLNEEDKFEISKEKRKFVIITPVWNSESYIEKCINSVANQLYSNYEMYIINDKSTDKTLSIINQTLDRLPQEIQKNFYIINDNIKRYAVANQQYLIENYVKNPEDVIILLDGDDWLINDPHIFDYLDNIYEDGYDMTYGSCHSLCDNIDLIAEIYPEQIITTKQYRSYLFSWGMPYPHLRTFKKSLFDKIDKTQLRQPNGDYWKAGGDNSLFYPLIENAEKFKCIQKVLMVYNDTNPLNDYKIHEEEQNRTANQIRGLRRKTEVIEQKMDSKINSKIDYNDIAQMLYYIHQDVLNKKPEAIQVYKDLIQHRTNVWIDNTESTTIKVRQDWLVNWLKTNNISKKAKILDIGAWTGKFAADIYLEQYTDITCLEINEECIKIGKANFPFLKWFQGDIEKIQCSDKFDIIYMGEILEHLVNPFATIEKVRGWLTENGSLLFTVPTKETVFGETPNSALEHISLITEEDLKKYSNDVTILKEDSIFFDWYVGSIKKYNSIFIPKIEGEFRSILIAVPTAKYIETDTFKSIYNLIPPRNTKLHFECFYGYTVDQVRNLMAHYTIVNNFDYIFFVDSDIVLPSDALVKLLSHKKEIVSGIYRQRLLEKNIVELYVEKDGIGKRIDISELPSQGLMEVTMCGFGCTLVAKQLLEKIGYPQFQYHSSIDFKNTISEDSDFCLKAKGKGSPIFVDTSLRCGHIGSFELKI